MENSLLINDPFRKKVRLFKNRIKPTGDITIIFESTFISISYTKKKKGAIFFSLNLSSLLFNIGLDAGFLILEDIFFEN